MQSPNFIKFQFLAEMAFPAPVTFQGGRGVPGPAGKAWRKVNVDGVQQAILSMSGRKEPSPGGIEASTIHLRWECDAAWVTTLIWSAICLGAHPWSWMIAKGITIPQPRKPTYTTIQSYRVISLLNCLGKVTENDVAEML
ncbi:hypothetical protein FPQ18DRAFT_82519 [Pyronema domesticum]|nr:hypothetical protein FPQ18DRAFT_82519 [Pyronema domesticum]